MIAKSDIVILLVATTALGISVLRWSAVQPDTPRAITATAPPPSSAPVSNAPASSGTPVPAVSLDNPGVSAGNPPIEQTPGTNGASAAGNAGTASGSTTSAAAGNGSNPTPEQADTSDSNGTGVHTVVSGDSLGVIANRYNTSVLELQVINGLEGTTIYVGQELRYPLTSN